MNEHDFDLLVESIKQAGEIKRGERKPSRIFEFSPPDVKAIREVITRMKQGEVLVITPEGTRSKVGYLIEGKQGVSYLAAKLGYPILPGGITGSFDPLFFGQLKRLKRPRITVTVGPAFSLPPLPSEIQGREEMLKADTEEIMCRIAVLLPEEYRGFYKEFPRLKALLIEQPCLG